MRTNIKIKTKFARESSLRRKPQHEALWDRSWVRLGALGALLGRFWAFSGRSEGALGAFLGRFGALVDGLGCFLGTLGTFLVALGLSGAPNG